LYVAYLFLLSPADSEKDGEVAIQAQMVQQQNVSEAEKPVTSQPAE